MLTKHNTYARSVLVPMMKHSIEELIKMAEVENLEARYRAVVGHARGVLNEIDFEMRGKPDFIPDEEIVAMYLSGMSFVDVAAQCNTNVETVRRALNRLGVKARPRGPASRNPRGHLREASQRVEEMIALWNEGQTLQQIGEKYDITRERVRQLLTREGVDTSNRPLTPKQKAAVQEYLKGRSLVEAAERAGVNAATLRGWVVHDGHQIRPSRKQRQRSPHTLEYAKIAAQMYREGKTTKEIAKHLGYSSPERGGGAMVYRLLAIAKVKLDRTAPATRRRIRGA